jgi:EAL domain-containing protein (putative c-di-GMP-specific phosphodiesterase class I)/GGDEF domain-containing protein
MEVLAAFSNDKNPSIFINRIARFMAAAPDREYAFIQFDVRKFRYINETYGSRVGDDILKYISDTLDVMCDNDHLHCRLTADLYQVVTYYNSREEILDFIDALDRRLHRYGEIRFTMSYGVSVAPGTSTAYRKHGDEAGLAREKCKNAILSKVLFYEDSLMKNVKKSGAIEELEEEALENGEFHVYLQPKYIYNKHEAAIVGAEALVRWIDKEGKVKSPVDFIPVFEENGFILKLDQFMWESVCKLIRKWLDAGIKAVPISVNVSRTYLYKFDVVTYIKGLIDKYNVPIDLLQIEITETTESEETIQYAEKFKEAGFTLMMDDFGSGYSSLSMLKDMPFDVLKMDRSFLDECLDNEHGRTIVSHVISMSNDLELNIIAEGVETKEMADFLYDNGCDVSQGYYFSKPLPIEDFEALWMHSDNNRKFEEV